MRWLAALALAFAPACHLGPYYDVREYSCGHDFAGAGFDAIRPNATTATELFAKLGPPQRVERRGERTFLTWHRTRSSRENFGVGIGALSMNVQILDMEYRAEPTQSITVVMEDDRVVACGRTFTPGAD